jgi:pimeloyl-ACP methyl ester carboxylesterase
MLRPVTRYVKSGRYNIAYRVVGEGELDLLWIHGFVSNVELAWEEPRLSSFLSRLASFSRLITFDKRGTGMSGRVGQDELPTLEERMEDVEAVLDAAGSKRASLFSHSKGGSLAVLYAATHPERTTALVTAGIFAKRIWSPDYPWAPKPDDRAREIAELERTWGTDADVEHLAPSASRDPAFRERLPAYFRRSASPGAAAALIRMNTQIDVRDVLPTIRAPTLVLHRTGDRDASVEERRWIAKQIPGAKFVELPGDDHLPWAGVGIGCSTRWSDFSPAACRPLQTTGFSQRFWSRHRRVDAARGGARRSALARAARAASCRGARRARRLRWSGGRHGGRGFVATFEGPGRAISAAVAIAERTRALGIPIRAGIHTGECERIAGKVGGIECTSRPGSPLRRSRLKSSSHAP